MNLNLARKWRSKNFDTIVGQELTIKMLKNSLYLGHFFPVYLFSGQRGCGKTTTARVFAAAVNCALLPEFQKNPKQHAVPCLQCASCVAMAQGQHPDFIEMDAASHTGVDDVRAIVEAAALLPVMGRKKVYLIDEAHMLSKAAFNAFLKILEEPPRSVLFILATTDPHKIIDTVMSRCFQLSFKAVSEQPLLAHLQEICASEQIRYAPGGLEHIIQATEGSVRDALNMVEQARFSGGIITAEAVHSLLGQLTDEQALRLFELVLHKGPREVLSFLQAHRVSSFSASAVWRTLTELVRAALWVRHGVAPQAYKDFQAQLQQLVMSVSVERLRALAEILYEHEQLFLRTTAQHELIELLLLRMCKQINPDDTSGAAGVPSSPSAAASVSSASVVGSQEEETGEQEEDDEDSDEIIDDSQSRAPWDIFLADLEQLKDPLLSSIFTQGTFVAYHADAGTLEVQFSKELIFFKDWLEDTKKSWRPLLLKQFGPSVSFAPLFTGVSRAAEKKTHTGASNASQEPSLALAFSKTDQEKLVVHDSGVAQQSVKNSSMGFPGAPKNVPVKVGWAGQKSGSSWANNTGQRGQPYYAHSRNAGPRQKPERPLDVADASSWRKATMLVQYFPGTLSEIEEKMESLS
ncbi:DNA polymerase III, subunit gamma and tau [Candidatus Dependentiae bacterium HGW-Dependentiae-1]|nr:MAG: DNA polymerase III, subunit gamma and tau [Candidatus Dependentiae bacterium HGW-Dependentiae-1]